METAAYFVVAESLTNAAKHAGPDARARVTIRDGYDRLMLEITDDGRGGADPAGSGLTGLRHRVEALDGALAVTSAAGSGTTIRAELPYGVASCLPPACTGSAPPIPGRDRTSRSAASCSRTS